MKSRVRYLLVGVLAVFLGSSLTYIRLNINNFKKTPKTLDSEEIRDQTSSVDDTIKLRTIDKKDEKTINQIYDLTINGIKKRVNVVFTLKEDKNTFEIEGKVNELKIFSYSGKKLEEKIEETFTPEFIKKLFNLNNFALIKGLDGKNYLVLYNYDNISNNRNYYIFNQNMILLNVEQNITIYDKETNIVLEGGANIWYKDEYNFCAESTACHIKAKIEKNKIYNLVVKLTENPIENNFGTLEEYIIMPDHDILITELISTYKIVNTEKSENKITP